MSEFSQLHKLDHNINIYSYTLNFGSELQTNLHSREQFHPTGSQSSGYNKRSLLPGDFSCPTPEDSSSSADCTAELEDDSADPSDPDDVSDEAERRDLNSTIFSPGGCFFFK
jgi:hypothetical protein